MKGSGQATRYRNCQKSRVMIGYILHEYELAFLVHMSTEIGLASLGIQQKSSQGNNYGCQVDIIARMMPESVAIFL